jgi:hypothetical protein
LPQAKHRQFIRINLLASCRQFVASAFLGRPEPCAALCRLQCQAVELRTGLPETGKPRTTVAKDAGAGIRNLRR